MAPQKKVTLQEAREWVENALRNFDRDDFTKLDDALNGGACEEFIDSFRPVETKTPKKKKSPSPKKEVIPDAPFDMLCCPARADKKDVMGFRINCQCTNKKPGDGELCPTHTKKKNSKKGLELGLYEEYRPEKWADGSTIIWSDSSEEVKAGAKKKTKRKVTCTICGVVGHTKRTCPQKCEKVEEKVDEKVEEKVLLIDEPPITPEEEKEIFGGDSEEGGAVKLNEEVKIIGGVNPAGEKYEVEIHTCEPIDPVNQDILPHDWEPEPEYESEPQDDSQKTEPLSDVEELGYDCASDEDEDSKPIDFEGVKYEIDGDGVAVYDDDGDHVGNWDGEKIDFLNAGWRKSHSEKVKEVDEEPKEPSLESRSWKDLKKMAKELGVPSEDIEDASDLEGEERVKKIISFIQQKS
jgi:hypothetical protein